jgi:hypothetical protein
MSWNRGQYKEQGRVQADAENAARWTSTTVDSLFALVYDMGWRRILNADAAYRYTELTVTPDQNGLVALATIDAAIAPSRRYRILDQITVRNKKLTGPTQVVLNPTVMGDYVRYGVTGGSGPITTWVNHMPFNPQTLPTLWGDVNADGVVTADDANQIARYTVGLPVTNTAALLQRGDVNGTGVIDVLDAQQILLYADGLAVTNPTAAARLGTSVPNGSQIPNDQVAVIWPAGFELALVYHLAGMLLTKGSVEANAGSGLFAVADSLYTEMLQAIMDRTTQHQQIVPTDTADSWSAGMVY